MIGRDVLKAAIEAAGFKPRHCAGYDCDWVFYKGKARAELHVDADCVAHVYILRLDIHVPRYCSERFSYDRVFHVDRAVDEREIMLDHGVSYTALMLQNTMKVIFNFTDSENDICLPNKQEFNSLYEILALVCQYGSRQAYDYMRKFIDSMRKLEQYCDSSDTTCYYKEVENGEHEA